MSPREKISYRMLALTLAIALAISAAAIAQQSLSGFSIFSDGNEFSTEIAQAGGGFIEGGDYQTEVFTEPLQGKAEGAGYSLAVGSADFFSEEQPANVENQTVLTTIAGQADKSPPQIISSINYPEQPAVGEEVEFYAEAVDDVSLFSAVLEIAGKNASTQNLGGKKATASFKFMPESGAGGKLPWRIFISDSSGNEASTERKEFSILSVAPLSRECRLERPKALEAPCVNGKKKTYEFSCNSKIGKWEAASKEVVCLGLPDLNIGDESLPLEKIAAALIAVALGAAGIYEYKKNPEKFRAWILKIKNIFPRVEEKPGLKPAEEKKKEEPTVPLEKKRKRKIPVLKY